MTVEEYSALALRTADPTDDRVQTRDLIITGDQAQLVLGALGLAGEAGEFADMVKKHIFHGHPFDINKAIKEVGDVQWYTNYAAIRCCGVSLIAVMEANIAKLKARYPEGKFSSERSQVRAAGDE